MAHIHPLLALRYDLEVTDGLDPVVAPPYDVIDAEQRAALAARSPYNVVSIDLPEDPAGGDPYAHAATLIAQWEDDGALVRDPEPAVYALVQDYAAPDGSQQTRRGFLTRVRVEEYGPGKIRPHERTHPGPKEDRLRLTRATEANLSPIFSLYSDPQQNAWRALEPFTTQEPWGSATDADGTLNRVWRITDPKAIELTQHALAGVELLIADGHHRYETARVYADEIGGEGAHRFVLMCLVALEDPGLLVFPTHRLVSGLQGDSERQEALAATIKEHFEIEPIEHSELRPPDGVGPLTFGYIDSHLKQAFRCTLKSQSIADAALPGMPDAYRSLDTAVLEALILMGPLKLTEDDISHLNGMGYSRTDEEALELVLNGTYDVAFFLRASPVSQVQAIAAAGVNMPPKSTFFYPKVPTGLVMNPLA
jgi:uncharacterized protein (DUF1015 family)